MSFGIALSGLNAATTDLTVTANNIANVSTNGFKGSRAEFAEMFSVSPQGVASIATGNGVRVASVAQQFTQGNIDNTGNSLDLAISGQGFFVLSDKGAQLYTRAGAFRTDNQGYIVNSNGQHLQAYPPSPSGGFNTGTLGDLRLLTGESPPNATSSMEMVLNLPSDADLPTNPAFDPIDTESYNRATSLTVYDSLGAAHTGTVYFQKSAPGQWNTYLYIDGAPVETLAAPVNGAATSGVNLPGLDYTASGVPAMDLEINGATVNLAGVTDATSLLGAINGALPAGVTATISPALPAANARLAFSNSTGTPVTFGGVDVDALLGASLATSGVPAQLPIGAPAAQQLVFNNMGELIVPANGTIDYPVYTPATGAANMDLALDFSGATQYGSTFGVTAITQDGYTTGQLVGINIDSTGVVEARYTNGRSQTLGQVAMANFANPNGLQQLSDTNWAETFTSGDALVGQAGNTGFGLIQSGALEGANVDITEQLVNMITAQRNFQANAQMIQTSDQITQTIINIR
jgi:flagellar hook protein FlgE